MQHFLKWTQNQQYIGQVPGLPKGGPTALRNPWILINLRVGDVLSFEQFAEGTPLGYMALCNPKLQRFLEQPQNQQYIAPICAGQGQVPLTINWILNLVADGAISFGELVSISSDGRSGTFSDPRVQHLFQSPQNWNEFDRLADLSEMIAKFPLPHTHP